MGKNVIDTIAAIVFEEDYNKRQQLLDEYLNSGEEEQKNESTEDSGEKRLHRMQKGRVLKFQKRQQN